MSITKSRTHDRCVVALCVHVYAGPIDFGNNNGFLSDIVLSRIHFSVVRIDQPAAGTNTTQLLCHLPGRHFPDVAEYRILLRRHFAGEGKSSSSHLFCVY